MRNRLVSALLALALPSSAGAHHPGSHASRAADGQVRLDVAALVADDCTTIAAVSVGAPPGLSAPSGSTPVTVRLERRPGACNPAATSVKAERLLALGGEVRQLHLFIVGPQGSVTGTERVPVR